MSSPWARTQASATWAGVASSSPATASTSSRIRRLCSKLPSVKRGLEARKSPSASSAARSRKRAGQEPAPERRVGDEPDPELAQQRQDLLLRVAGPERVLGLQRRDRVGGVGAADRLGRGLGEPDVADLALLDELAEGADRLLDRRLGVDAVLVVEVDVVGPEPLQRALDRDAEVLRVSRRSARSPPCGARGCRTSSRRRTRRGGPRSPGRPAPRS